MLGTVGIISASPDLIGVLDTVLEEYGYDLIPKTHQQDFRKHNLDIDDFIENYKIDILIVDIEPPYTENWITINEELKRQHRNHIPIVFTSTNVHDLEDLYKTWHPVEILNIPFDVDQLISAINERLKYDTIGPILG